MSYTYVDYVVLSFCSFFASTIAIVVLVAEHALIHSKFCLGRSLLCVEYMFRIEIPHFVLSLCFFWIHS